VYVYVLVYVSKLDSVCDIGVWRFDLEEWRELGWE
jgi:hypothetical protein